jgi:hypothetical protein
MILDRSLMQKSVAMTVLCLITTLAFGQTDGQKGHSGNPYGLSAEKIQWMKEATLNQLKGCRVKGAGGTWLHTPDGVGNYKALWTRDFYYMVEYAGDLMDPNEIKASIDYLLNG